MITQTGLVYSFSLAKPSLPIILGWLLLLNLTILKFKYFMWLVIKRIGWQDPLFTLLSLTCSPLINTPR